MKILGRLINSWIGGEKREMVRKHAAAEDCSFALMLDSLRVAVAMPSLPKTSSQMQSKWQEKGRAEELQLLSHQTTRKLLENCVDLENIFKEQRNFCLALAEIVMCAWYHSHLLL